MANLPKAITDYGLQPLALFLDLRNGNWRADLHLTSGASLPAARHSDVLHESTKGHVQRLGLKWFRGEAWNDYIAGDAGKSHTAAIVGSMSDLQQLALDLHANETFAQLIEEVGGRRPTQDDFGTICHMIQLIGQWHPHATKAFVAIASKIHHVDSLDVGQLIVLRPPTGVSRTVGVDVPYLGVLRAAELYAAGSDRSRHLCDVERRTGTVFTHPSFPQVSASTPPTSILTQGGRAKEDPQQRRLQEIREGDAFTVQEEGAVQHNSQTVMRSTVFLWVGAIDEDEHEALMFDVFMRPVGGHLRTGVLGFNHYDTLELHRLLQPDLWKAFATAESLDRHIEYLRKIAALVRKMQDVSKAGTAELLINQLRDEFSSSAGTWALLLEAALLAAQQKPPRDKPAFVGMVNLYLAAFQKAIKADDDHLYRLRVQPGKSGRGYLALDGLGENKRNRGFASSKIRLVDYLDGAAPRRTRRVRVPTPDPR